MNTRFIVFSFVVSWLLGFSAMAQANDAVRVSELLKKNNCMTCHALERKLVGPSFREVGKTFIGGATDANVKRLAEKLMRGGSGKFGPIPMPASPKLKAEEATFLAKWVLNGAP